MMIYPRIIWVIFLAAGLLTAAPTRGSLRPDLAAPVAARESAVRPAAEAQEQPIWAHSRPAGTVEVVLFRKVFTLTEPLSSVELYLDAGNHYEAWLDGQWLASGPAGFSLAGTAPDAAPGYAFTPQRLGDLPAGDHVLAVAVQWSSARRAAGVLQSPGGVEYCQDDGPFLLARLQGITPQGRQQALPSGADWLAFSAGRWDRPPEGGSAAELGPAEIVAATRLLDLQRLPASWTAYGYSTEGWQTAVIKPASASQCAASAVDTSGYLDPWPAPADFAQGLALPDVLAAQNAAAAQDGPGLADPPCDNPGWFPTNYKLKDHHVFRYQGYYYLVSGSANNETYFVYGRSKDLCTWKALSPVLRYRKPNPWDKSAIWAPYVWEEQGVYTLYYTGVTSDFTQSILAVTTTNPADPYSWQPAGMLFQPNHPGMAWQPKQWADCRDPNVVKIDGLYYLHYTGLDTSGAIIGLATAVSPLGPWLDWGAVVTGDGGPMMESANLVRYGKGYYLLYNRAGVGEHYRMGASPAGPWLRETAFSPGWAHKAWLDQDGEWRTSYLTDYSVTISPLGWDQFFNPPHPFIGKAIYHTLFPLVMTSPGSPGISTYDR